jgi:hypothetical protein
MKPLVSAAYRRNIDFETGDNIFDNLMNSKVKIATDYDTNLLPEKTQSSYSE